MRRPPAATRRTGVGSADIRCHAAIVDSPRLDAFYAQVAAELRPCFGRLVGSGT